MTGWVMPEVGTPLTPREREVLRAAARGLEDAEIAAELFLSIDTVKTYLRRLRAKLGARSRGHAIALAYECGLLKTPVMASAVRAARPLLVGIPQCGRHPVLSPLPGQCVRCATWVSARRVVAQLDGALAGVAGGRDA